MMLVNTVHILRHRQNQIFDYCFHLPVQIHHLIVQQFQDLLVFQSITVTIEAQSEEQLRLIHQDLMDTGLVSMVL